MRFSAKVLAVVGGLFGAVFAGSAGAQAPTPGTPPSGQGAHQPPGPSPDYPPIRHVRLTEKHIKSFLGAEVELADVAKRLGVKPGDPPDPKVKAELEAAAKKHGFADFGEYIDVAQNIDMVFSGIDQATGKPLDAVVAINNEIAQVKGDANIAAKEKEIILKELGESLDNAKIVAKFRAEIEKVQQQ